MRICHIVRDVTGGVSSQVVVLSKGQQQHGVSVRVVQLGDAGPATVRLRDAGIPVTVLHTSSGHDLSLVGRLHKALGEGQDVLHWHERQMFGAIEAARRPEAQVMTVHGMLPVKQVHRSLTDWWYGKALQGVIAVSEHVAQSCRSLDVFQKCKWKVIPNCIDTEVYHPGPGRGELQVGEPVKLIVVSRLERDKCVDDALQAVKVLHGRGVPVTLKILGGGTQKAALEALAEREGLADCVEFLGHVLNPVDHLRGCHGFLLLSEYESFCLAAMEAAACGVPVFAYPIEGGVNEWLWSGHAGEVADARTPERLADVVYDGCRDPSAWRALSESASSVAGEYAKEPIARATLDFYESLIG